MANNPSAQKRIRTSTRKRQENAPYKSMIRTYVKKYFVTLSVYQSDPNTQTYNQVQTALSLAYSKIDRAKKKHILVRNSAARKKSRLAKALEVAHKSHQMVEAKTKKNKKTKK